MATRIWSYTIIVRTENPKDLENVLNNEFQKLAGHRNKIVFYRAEPFANLSKALAERYNTKLPKSFIGRQVKRFIGKQVD